MTVRKALALPDGNFTLEAFDDLAGRFVRSIAVGRRDGDSHTDFADCQLADPVNGSDVTDIKARYDVLANLIEHRGGHVLVRLVAQAYDRLTSILVSHDACKQQHGSVCIAAYTLHDENGIDRLRGDLAKHFNPPPPVG